MEKDVHERFFDRMERSMEENQRQLAEGQRTLEEYKLQSKENALAFKEQFAEVGRNIDRNSELIAEFERNIDKRDRSLKEQFAEIGRNIDKHGEQLAEVGRNIDKHGEQLAEVGRNIDKHGEQLAEVGRNIDKHGEQLAEVGRNIDKHGEQLAEVGRNIDKLGSKYDGLNGRVEGIASSNGLFAEEYFINALEDKLEFAGHSFETLITGKRARNLPGGKRLRGQYDIVLASPEAVAIIEIKYKADTDDLDDFVNRKVSSFRALYPEYAHLGLYLGIASLSFNSFVVDKARELGIGLVKQVGRALEYENDWAVMAY